MTDKSKKQAFDFSVYKQFPIRLHTNKCADIERIHKIADIQARGISFTDFVRESLDKYTIKNNGE